MGGVSLMKILIFCSRCVILFLAKHSRLKKENNPSISHQPDGFSENS